MTEPACWTWPEPLRPVVNSLSTVRAWQDGRCAVCGLRPPALQEDHDHSTGDTRGYLCPGCNVREGSSSAPVFTAYRERPPTVILGVLWAYRRTVHPTVHAARVALQRTHRHLVDLCERHPELFPPAPPSDPYERALQARRRRGTGPPPARLDGCRPPR